MALDPENPPAGPSGQQGVAPNDPENRRLLDVSDQGFEIGWDPPSSGPEPTTYWINLWRPEFSRWVGFRQLAGTARSHRFGGLRAATTYTYDLRAGIGTLFSAANLFTATTLSFSTVAPGEPVIFPAAVEVDPDDTLPDEARRVTVRVSWRAGAGGQPNRYETRLAGFFGGAWRSVGNNRGQSFLTDLRAFPPGSTHTVHVRAVNAAGTAASSLDFTIPGAPVVPPEPVEPAAPPAEESLEAAAPLIGKANVRALAAAAAGHTNVRPGPLPVDAPRGMRRYLASVLGGRRAGVRAPEGLPPKVRRVLNRSFRG